MRSMLSVVLLVLTVADAPAQAAWVVDPTPLLDIAAVSKEGTVVFSYAAGGVRLADGRLLIADRSENTIRVLDAAGKLVRSVGRTGDGPGEFQSMIWAGRCRGDSLLVWDLRRRQATMVGASGAAARQFAVPTGDTAQSPYQFSCSPGGRIVYRSAPRPLRGAVNPQNPNVVGVSAAVYAVSADGAIVQRLGEIAAGEVVAMVSPGGGRGAAPRPLGRSASIAAVDDAVIIGSADSAFVTVWRANVQPSRHSLPIVLRAPTQREFDEAVQVLASMAPASMRQAMIQQLAAIPPPERLPPISALFVDSDGLIWIQTTPAGARTLDFLIMRGDGRVVARAQVPMGLTVFEIGRDYLLGSYTDAADEMHVAMYRLRRS